ALAFNASTAHAGSPLINDVIVGAHYLGHLSTEMGKAAGDSLVGGNAGAFAMALEYGLCRTEGNAEGECKAKWKGAADAIPDNGNFGLKPVIIFDFDPTKYSRDTWMASGVVPPLALETSPIPVCLEKNNHVLGTWKIMSNGQVIADAWNGATSSPVMDGGG